MKHTAHKSISRSIGYHYWPLPEVECGPVERVLASAQRDGTIYEWWTSRSGQSWHFSGWPGPAMRALRAKVVALLGGPGHARQWHELPPCKHCDCGAVCLATRRKAYR